MLQLLEFREVPVPEAVRERITECTRLADLDLWFERALGVSTADELFQATDRPRP